MFYNKKNTIFIIALFVIVTLIFVLRGGSSGIEFDISDETLTMSYSDKYSFAVPIRDIDTVELADGLDLGECIEGEAGKKYSYGTWENTPYGEYSLCCLTKVTTYVVITDKDGEHYVFNIENASSTTEMKDALITYMESLE